MKRLSFSGVAETLHLARQFVLVDLAGVPDGFDHLAALQRHHPLLTFVPGGVGHDEVGVELGIERAAGVVAEHGGAEVAGGAGAL